MHSYVAYNGKYILDFEWPDGESVYILDAETLESRLKTLESVENIPLWDLLAKVERLAFEVEHGIALPNVRVSFKPAGKGFIWRGDKCCA